MLEKLINFLNLDAVRLHIVLLGFILNGYFFYKSTVELIKCLNSQES